MLAFKPVCKHVTVGRGLAAPDGAGERTRTGNVLDDEWLAKLLGQLLADDARDDVGAAAWRRSDDVGDRAAWDNPPLRRCLRSQRS